MAFVNRQEAARVLADRLAAYRGTRPLVLGIPRGGVPMADRIARELDGELDVVLVHKLRAPANPEVAVGSVSEWGDVIVADHARVMGAGPEEIRREAAEQLAALRKRRRMYGRVRPPVDPAGRVVIVVDDGIATGSTVIAAIQSIRRRKPARIIVATGVAPRDTLERIRAEADEVVCLIPAEDFRAVGDYYEDFSPTSDVQVTRLLAAAGRAGAGEVGPEGAVRPGRRRREAEARNRK